MSMLHPAAMLHTLQSHTLAAVSITRGSFVAILSIFLISPASCRVLILVRVDAVIFGERNRQETATIKLSAPMFCRVSCLKAYNWTHLLTLKMTILVLPRPSDAPSNKEKVYNTLHHPHTWYTGIQPKCPAITAPVQLQHLLCPMVAASRTGC